MRSCVRCGIDFAEGALLMTRETVAGERPRCAASDFKLTDCEGVLIRSSEGAAGLGRGIRGVLPRSLPHAGARSKNWKVCEKGQTAVSVICDAYVFLPLPAESRTHYPLDNPSATGVSYSPLHLVNRFTKFGFPILTSR